jgi:hypothetical protein
MPQLVAFKITQLSNLDKLKFIEHESGPYAITNAYLSIKIITLTFSGLNLSI